jgi:hypothetical protein
MNRQRLLRLADHLDTVPKELFNMRTWYTSYRGCGTVACAAGHAAAVPEFKDEGFALETTDDCEKEPVYKGHTGFEACSAFFKLDFNTNQRIFTRYSYGEDDPTPKEVANRIREILTADKK